MLLAVLSQGILSGRDGPNYGVHAAQFTLYRRFAGKLPRHSSSQLTCRPKSFETQVHCHDCQIKEVQFAIKPDSGEEKRGAPVFF